MVAHAGAVVEKEELLVGSADANANIRRGVHVEFDIAHAVGELEVGDTDGVFWVGDDEDLIQREALSVLSRVNWKVWWPHSGRHLPQSHKEYTICMSPHTCCPCKP